MPAETNEKIARLYALIDAAPDPAFYKPDELVAAWMRWHKAVCAERKNDTGGHVE